MAAVVVMAGACGGGEAAPAARVGLDDPAKKAVAMQLVSSAENSSLDWEAQYAYLEDIGDGRGYTGGIIGFTSATGDMLRVVRQFAEAEPGNALAGFVPALEAVDGTDSHEGLGAPFEAAWRATGADPEFRRAQDAERDAVYFDPAVATGRTDGLGALGQFAYDDALVVHGPGPDWPSFDTIRERARDRAPTPADGGDETAYLGSFLDVRDEAMREEEAHQDTSRVDTAQRVLLREGNLDLDPPLVWHVYGDEYRIP